MKSAQSLIIDTGGGGKEQSEYTPFKLNALNSTSPLENWNLTTLSKSTAGTSKLFWPSVNAVKFPK